MCCDRGLFTIFFVHEAEIRFEGKKIILARGKDDVNVIINREQIKFQNIFLLFIYILLKMPETERKPNLQYLRTFGSSTVALIKGNEGCGKFRPQGQKNIIVCYSQVAKAYRLYYTDNLKVIERRDVTFEENEFDNDKTTEPEKTKEDYLTIVSDNSNEQQKDDNVSQITTYANGSEIQSGDKSENLIEFETAEENEATIRRRIPQLVPAVDRKTDKRGRPCTFEQHG